jgi:hypothetical protein
VRAGDGEARSRLIAHAGEQLRCLTRRTLKGYPAVQRWEQTDDVRQNALLRLAAAPRPPVQDRSGLGPTSRAGGRPSITTHMPPRCATLTTCFCDARPRIASPFWVAAKPMTV